MAESRPQRNFKKQKNNNVRILHKDIIRERENVKKSFLKERPLE